MYDEITSSFETTGGAQQECSISTLVYFPTTTTITTASSSFQLSSERQMQLLTVWHESTHVKKTKIQRVTGIERI